MSYRLNTTARKRQSSDSTFNVNPFQPHGFVVQARSEESTPVTKAQLWENYQQAKQLNHDSAKLLPIQAKLTIGQPGDKYEQEADSVADRVLAMSESRQVCLESENNTIQRDGIAPIQITWSDLETRLQNASRGREALQIKAQYNVPIQWDTTLAAAFFSPDTKICYLNPTQKLDLLASYFVHEMFHAQMFHTNQSADAKSSDEATFVKKMVDEEIVGTTRQFEVKLELNRSGDASNYAPGEERYRGAYKFKKDKAIESGKSEQEAHQEGLANGRRMVEVLIRPGDGTWPRLGPSNLESYEMMYKREWRKTNKIKKS